jgi:peptide/nickel transport system ATP-binding protein
MSLIKVSNLSICLHNGAYIVEDVSFNIASGETFALLGESGCGKSMTALSMMRLLPDGIRISAGAVQLEGQELLGLQEREMREIRGGKMSIIFQEPGLSLNPVMTVGEQITEVLTLHLGMADAAAQQRSVELLDHVGIPDATRRVDEYPFQLSGGMKQRVMIAMALAGSPKLLVADEPTTALDVTIQAQVLQLLRDMQVKTGMAMLLITHDLGVVFENADHVGVMYAGQIIEQASREQLFSNPLHPYTEKLLAALPNASRTGQQLSAIPGSVPPLGSIKNGCRFVARCDKAWALCNEQTPEWTFLAEGHGVRCHLHSGSEVPAEIPKDVSETLCVPDSGAMHGEPLLKVDDLEVHFPIRKGLLQRTIGHVKAVDGVSMELQKGKTLALVGESGCGKTTLGKSLLQLILPTGGSVQFGGSELAGLKSSNSKIQMVFQDPYASLNPKMRIAEILEEGMSALNIGENGAIRQIRIDELLERVGLERESKWRYPHEFSGGQRQRIAIARALAVSPQLLICDEPTSALDVSVQAQILNLLKILQRDLGLGYLFITHNLAVVEYLAHEVCVMYLGRIVERGTAKEVLNMPKHPYTQALLSAVPRIGEEGKKFIRLEGDMPSPSNPPEGCHFAPRCPHVMEVCRLDYPPVVGISNTHKIHCYLLSA